MNELEKAAEKREIEICQYSTKDCLNTNYCHRCQWGVPSLDLRCSNNASFKLGAQWQAKQSPWISVEERMPERHVKVFFIVQRADITSYQVGFCGTKGEWETYHGIIFCPDSKYARVTHWMPIPE